MKDWEPLHAASELLQVTVDAFHARICGCTLLHAAKRYCYMLLLSHVAVVYCHVPLHACTCCRSMSTPSTSASSTAR